MSTGIKTAVVTGAASGIGRALAEELRARGTDLVLADTDTDALSEVATRLDATGVPADVSDQAAMDALAAKAPDARLVCLNAGVVGASLGAPWEVPPGEWDRVFGVNVVGVVNGLRAFVPKLLASGERAHVLITASLAGLAVFPGGGAYGPSKHAVTAVAQHAAMALADTPVRVSMICPALVATGMSSEGADPADVAREALRTLDDGVFSVVPAEWRTAVVEQAERLACGQQPKPPTPDSR
ncbi:NADP-dependent 3-hydroxy acid dehydrogenase YdfG [Saccharopolyspora erythraea NRRL 2338]|uniref:Short chain dehydrogenase/reductase SDR n=2 Tax=Saccharopolyspora erythraea TaxID=1836 RepID=A4FKI8_SACEN|nr:SDR family NAD(P)-dependent oxidoreductase [Saccharopolyspora erythraea]EQD82262.1 oxidoreductase [Saccharopolyspora erythraea D]PFG98201.1 NADP-dependent 3-hydroxy acid dehydrogenase YdfG [Saccharopolyspora erythraea NRRL 2338]QRK88301.1 SDR family NAD(P)-dependent oxidoreductase [Saccharopolyspora erythraea]CAM04563.1 short chain dehydrogenase/reductase SDR [Saccharopolyspora erythraea NRRL 2338]